MNMQDLHRMLQPIEHWNRKILAVLWVVFGFAVCIGIVHLVVVGAAWKHILVGSVLLPIGLLLVVIGVSEWLVRSSPVPKDWILLVAADFIAVCLLICNPELPITASVFFLPILISVFYFVPKKVMYMTVAACLSLLAVYGVDPPLRAHLDVADLITFIAVLLAGGFICVQFMQRSVEMVAQLQLSIEANQDLMVQKIMMESVSKRDGLTDAYNHKSFHQHLENVLRQSDAQGTPVHLLIFDIDNFKRINDTFGHHVGDQILRRVVQVMKEQVGPNDFVARYGGEEFALILLDRSDAEADQIGECIRLNVRAMHHEEIDGSVSISGGLARYEPGRGKEWLFVTADEMLYRAKHEGKDKIVAHHAIRAR